MVTDLGHPGYRGRLSENAVTIAEVLKSAGYRTFMSGKWHVGTNDPTRHGFEQYFGTLISAATSGTPRSTCVCHREAGPEATTRMPFTAPTR